MFLVFALSFQDLQDLFHRIDIDESGTLDLKEVVIFFKSITDDIDMENIENIFQRLDEDNSKDLDYHEFKEIFLNFLYLRHFKSYFRICSMKLH